MSLCIVLLLLNIISFLVTSLAEQANARGRQSQEVRRMTMELEEAISERDSLKKSHQVLGEKLKAELAVTRAKYVLCCVRSLFYFVYFVSV